MVLTEIQKKELINKSDTDCHTVAEVYGELHEKEEKSNEKVEPTADKNELLATKLTIIDRYIKKPVRKIKKALENF